MRKLFMRSFAIAFVAFALLFGLEFFVEWRRAGPPDAGDLTWADGDNAKHVVARVADRVCDPMEAQPALSVRVGQIGTIIIKSLDRNDRDVAAEGAWAIKMLLDHYARHKSRMPKEWFVVDRADFVGLSDEALEMLTEARTWFEMKCLSQLELGFQRALHGASDTVSTFSDATRVIAVRAVEHHDEQALRLAIRFFNNYLREAIKA